ncbi:MAG: hypothetical protein JOZ20_00100 [Sphingomonas sp.]|nr:hypothetical protein [Sphingomonas sp.]MBW0008001.1 hypothetical protein [Sphingomonas sp.]
MSTIVAVALGVAPVNQDPQLVTGDYSRKIGSYSQTTDRRGTTHVRGRDAKGRTYDLTLDRQGNVEASTADRVVNFRVREG